jgi:ataxin-3
MEEEDEDEDEELDEDVFAPVGGMDIRGSGAGAGAHEEYGGPMDFAFQSRSYDDEDAALQAALKASMDDLPPGWVAPVFEENPVARKPSQSSAPAPAAVAPPGLSAQNRDEEIEEDDEVDEPQVEELSPGESARLSTYCI